MIAASLTVALLGRMVKHLVSLSVGVLLVTYLEPITTGVVRLVKG